MSALKLAAPALGAERPAAAEFDRAARTIMSRARVGDLLLLTRAEIETLLDLGLAADEAERAAT